MPPLTSQSDLQIIRRAYARQIVQAAGADDPRIEAALMEVRREAFLPPPRWIIPSFADLPAARPVDDPLYVYQDRLVSLRPDKLLNNGQPSFVTMLIGLGRLRDGETAIQIGTGTGYYTAIMSRLVGDAGSLLGIEYEPDLAEEARHNLASCRNVTIVRGDGFSLPLPEADVVYVNAGTPRLSPTWLDALRPGARLVVPLCGMTNENGKPVTRGGVFLIELDADGFAAAWKSPTSFYPCIGASDEGAEAALLKAFESGEASKVRRLHRTADVPKEACWLRGEGYCFAYA